MEKYGVRGLLTGKGIISPEGNLIDEPKFNEFLLGIFLFYLSFERYKKLVDDAVERQRKAILRDGRPLPFPIQAFPFRIFGLGEETIFVGKMDKPNEMFTEIIQENLFWNFNHIDRVLPYLNPEIVQAHSWKTHSCSKEYLEKYCPLCKKDFAVAALSHLSSYARSLGIGAYLRLKIPVSLFKPLIVADELIQLEQAIESCDNCGTELEGGWKHCPECTQRIERVETEENESDYGQPEEIFNEALGLYLSIKKGYTFKPNHILDKDFNNETDIYLQKDDAIRLIEYTTKLKVDKHYVIPKVKTLHLIEGSLVTEYIRNSKTVRPNCGLVLLPFNQPDNIEQLEILPLKIFENTEKFKIIKSNFKFKITNQMQIEQDELDKIKVAFNSTLADLLAAI